MATSTTVLPNQLRRVTKAGASLQVTIPKSIARHLGIQHGSGLIWDIDPEGGARVRLLTTFLHHPNKDPKP